MSPTTILEPTTHKPWRPRHLLQSNAVVLVAVSVLSFAAMLFAREAPVHPRSLTITNPSVYALGVEVAGADTGWADLTTVDRESTATVSQVFDEGTTWRLRFSGQGRDAGTITMSEDDLQRQNWTITVPTDITDHLVAAGTAESPKH
jgi:hypothetical protein